MDKKLKKNLSHHTYMHKCIEGLNKELIKTPLYV